MCLPLVLSRRITFWTGTMASIRASVDIHKNTNINSNKLDEALWFSVGSMRWSRYANTKSKGFITRHIETVPSLRSDTSCGPPKRNTIQRSLVKLVVCKFSVLACSSHSTELRNATPKHAGYTSV